MDDGSTAINTLVLGTPPATASGNVEVSVHSPVSLHAWNAEGGHVGWNAQANRSEATIAGGAYEGAPGGAQRIVLPAGFYKITIDEAEHGRYLLEVATNGTGADTEEAFLVAATPGRTTSTHYALTAGWDGPRLDAFPVRRGTTPAEVAFRDEGRPSVGASGGAGDVVAVPGADQASSDTPLPGAAWALLAVTGAAIVWGRRRA